MVENASLSVRFHKYILIFYPISAHSLAHYNPRWKIIIAGNHECSFHIDYFKSHPELWDGSDLQTPDDASAFANRVKNILADTSLRESHGIVYLEDTGFEIPEGGGIRVWGE